MRRSLISGLVVALLSSAVVISTAHADDKLIRVGFNPGPYKEQFQIGEHTSELRHLVCRLLLEKKKILSYNYNVSLQLTHLN